MRSKISLYKRCNRKGNIDISLKLHKKLRINNVEEHLSFYMIANRTIDLLQQRLRLQQYYHMAKVLAKSGVRSEFDQPIDCTSGVFKLRCVADVDFPIHKIKYIVGAGMSTVILSVATDVITVINGCITDSALVRGPKTVSVIHP